ncbi:hypothetical protein Leryth_010330 [Lithospermum erythrorhizon]|nr:hypothetical protein Leryth_010330 [Lithospermum erythrorhizon]
MSRLGGAGAVAPPVADISSQVGGDGGRPKGTLTASPSNNGKTTTVTEHQVAKLMEDMGRRTPPGQRSLPHAHFFGYCYFHCHVSFIQEPTAWIQRWCRGRWTVFSKRVGIVRSISHRSG